MVLKGAVLVNTTDDTEVCSNLEQTNWRIMIVLIEFLNIQRSRI